MQESRVTRGLNYKHIYNTKPKKNYDWLLMLIMLVLIIIGALVWQN